MIFSCFGCAARTVASERGSTINTIWLVELVSRRVIFRGRGEVGAESTLDTDIQFALFNLKFLEILSCEFSWGYRQSTEQYDS